MFAYAILKELDDDSRITGIGIDVDIKVCVEGCAEVNKRFYRVLALLSQVPVNLGDEFKLVSYSSFMKASKKLLPIFISHSDKVDNLKGFITISVYTEDVLSIFYNEKIIGIGKFSTAVEICEEILKGLQ